MSKASKEAQQRVRALDRAFGQWNLERGTIGPLLSEVQSLTELVPSQTLASKEYLYSALAQSISVKRGQANKGKGFLLRMHLLDKTNQGKGFVDLWQMFEQDFASIFKDYLG